MNAPLANYYNLAQSYLGKNCIYLTFFITSKCNARCSMCFYWREIDGAQEKKVLSAEEIELIAKNFKRLFYLSITGGEPTLRDDLPEIIYSFYRYSHTRYAAFSTNGLLPKKTKQITESVLEKCPGLNLKINVSIDHLEDKHDEIRGVKGTFKKALETVSLLNLLKEKYKNLSISVGTVLSSYNKKDIKEIINYIRKKVNPDAHSIELARGSTREEEAKDVSPAEYKEAIDYIKGCVHTRDKLMQSILDLVTEVNWKALKDDKMVLPCVAGKRIFTLTDDGFLLPCEMLGQFFPEKKNDFVIGNLREVNYDAGSLINSQRNKEISGFIKNSKCYCTFECATLWNILFSFKMYPEILFRLLK